MEYQLIDGDQTYALYADFDSRYERLSPGAYLNREMLQQIWGACVRYHFGPGEQRYKQRWANRSRRLLRLYACNNSMKGRMLKSLYTIRNILTRPTPE
jgi:CelD/BcsL family acetyltransferase involved in cellulose biosynthesis